MFVLFFCPGSKCILIKDYKLSYMVFCTYDVFIPWLQFIFFIFWGWEAVSIWTAVFVQHLTIHQVVSICRGVLFFVYILNKHIST